MAVASIAQCDWPEDWPELLPFLLKLISDQSNKDGGITWTCSRLFSCQMLNMQFVMKCTVGLCPLALTLQNKPGNMQLSCFHFFTYCYVNLCSSRSFKVFGFSLRWSRWYSGAKISSHSVPILAYNYILSPGEWFYIQYFIHLMPSLPSLIIHFLVIASFLQ